LTDFLAAGAPPVCVTFGSMIHQDAEKIDRIVREAMYQAGQRAVILSGWGRVHQVSSQNVLYLEAASHDWLLPQCKLVVYHGGAGTTFAGLRAGIPNVIVPFMADQPFWGRRVHMVGAGPQPLLVKRLSVEKLVLAMAEAESPVVRKQAQALGSKLRDEAGVAHAVQLLEGVAVHG
jgi:sterol 3beta-glucosyltransferase